jgi:hypothetical protein
MQPAGIRTPVGDISQLTTDAGHSSIFWAVNGEHPPGHTPSREDGEN